jgi:uncharacterized protein (DUF2267 family)
MPDFYPFPEPATITEWMRGAAALPPGRERELLLAVMGCMADLIADAEAEGFSAELPSWAEVLDYVRDDGSALPGFAAAPIYFFSAES